MLLRDNWHLSMPDRRNKIRSELVGILDAMSPETRAMFDQEIAPQLLEKFDSKLLNGAYELSFSRKPVDILTFIHDKYFLGNALAGNIFPMLVDDLQELFEGGYTEVLLKGSIGWGKTTMGYIGMAYDLYLVSCLKDPADTFGLLPGSNVAFINVSVNKKQATKILFGGLLNILSQSPYFRETFPYDRRIESEARFPKSVFCYPVAGNEQSLLGEAVFSAAFDEMNFYAVVEHSKKNPEGGTHDQAASLYNRMSRRLKSRMNQRGRLPGHLWMISSARYPTDWTERKAMEARTDKNIFVRDYAAWETRPKHYFMSKNFHVEVGDVTRRSRVLTGDESDVVEDRVIEVPMDFFEEFTKDPDSAVRDYAGISLLTIRPYIGRRDMIHKIFAMGEQAGYKHPYSKLDVTMQDEMDYLIPENLYWIDVPVKKKSYTQEPPEVERKLFPALRYVHVDLAKNRDAAGFCMVVPIGSKAVSRGIPSLEPVRTEVRPVMRIELLLRIVAPPGGEIQIPLVRGLLYRLHQLGIQFGKITYDSYGSEESLQILQQQGYEAEYMSLDKNMDGYECFKTAIYDERVLCYNVPKLEQETIQLEVNEKKQKVDHPPNGSKDLADAVAGAVTNCELGFHVANSEVMAPTRNPVENTAESLWSRIERGEQISEAEFDKL